MFKLRFMNIQEVNIMIKNKPKCKQDLFKTVQDLRKLVEGLSLVWLEARSTTLIRRLYRRRLRLHLDKCMEPPLEVLSL
jgi:RNase adaptor protein for sRNA GlmZ degradation